MKFKIILSILFLVLISCKNETSSEKERKLLEKELELTKREI